MNLLSQTCQKVGLAPLIVFARLSERVPTAIQHEKEIQRKQEDLNILQQKWSQAVESLKLQEETQGGLDASFRNEAAAYHSLSTRIPVFVCMAYRNAWLPESDLHATVSTHKQLAWARNKTTFEKRVRVSGILEEFGIVGSTDLASSTDAGMPSSAFTQK